MKFKVLQLLMGLAPILKGVKKGFNPFKALKTSNLMNGEKFKYEDKNDEMTKREFISIILTSVFVLASLVSMFVLVLNDRLGVQEFIKVIKWLIELVGFNS